jgi:hypothetical protein
VFEDGILRRIFGSERDVVIGYWRKQEGKWDGRVWTGFIWLRIGTGGWLQ